MAYVLLTVSIINFLLGLVISLRARMTRSNIIFLWFSLIASIWIFSNFLLKINPSTEILRLAYGLGLAVALLSLIWVYTFLDVKTPKFVSYLIIPAAAAVTLLSIFSPLVLEELVKILPLGYEADIGPIYHLYAVVLAVIISQGLWRLNKSHKTELDQIKKKQIRYILSGYLIFAVVSFTANFVLYYIQGSFAYVNFDDFSFMIFVLFIFRAIIRYQLFDFQIIATELFVGTLWTFMLARVFFSPNDTEALIDTFIFLATLIFGVLVIRSVLKEVRTSEKMEKLARELAGANARLKDLDQQKSEFLSIASHQLRSPLTAIKGYASMLQEGTFGQLPGKVDEALDRVSVSSNRLVFIIDDFLNIARIEQGKMKYDFEKVEMQSVIEGVIREQEHNVNQAGLKLELKVRGDGPFETVADYGKVRQVINNIIDNAIKYTPSGSITIKLYREGYPHHIHIEIVDTGIGIPKDVLPLLFQKFSRSKKAGKVNIQGTGLGLYVARELMKAHKGELWAESKGENKGSTFHIVLPIRSKEELDSEKGLSE